MPDAHDARAAARAQLASLLPRVMEDGKVDEREKQELLAVFKQGVLSVTDVREIFAGFLKGLQHEVMEDGFVTDEEQEKCRAAVRELRIPREFLSPELRAIIDGSKLPIT